VIFFKSLKFTILKDDNVDDFRSACLMLFSFLSRTMGRSDSALLHILLLLEDKIAFEFYFSMIKIHI